jgi:hypothetical protein
MGQSFLKIVYANRSTIRPENLGNVLTINPLDRSGRPQFIHSGIACRYRSCGM